MRSTRIQLLLLVIASGAGAVSWSIRRDWDATALLAGVAFVAAALLRLILLRTRPHRAWYDGRAAAESIKTLAWKYAVAGDPFVRDDPDADSRLAALGREVVGSFGVLASLVDETSTGPTDSMREARSKPLAGRKDLYARERIRDQHDWYQRKARSNGKRARFWGAVVLLLQVMAAIGAFLKGFGIVDIDIFGLAGAAVASAAAWLETKQHHALARAYRIASQELGDIQALIPAQREEAAWGTFVAESEEAISREHTMWKASSRNREPVTLA